MTKIGILDYGIGNLNSLLNVFHSAGAQTLLLDDASEISNVDGCVLPGVGSFKASMEMLENGGWIEAISEHALANKKPILGICLGMQLFAEWGTEGAGGSGVVSGLKFIKGDVQNLASLGSTARIPHMGWNNINIKLAHPMFNGIDSMLDYYFVHSYAFTPKCLNSIVATVTHGIEIVSAVAQDNIWGVQFHPEKSSRAGLQLIKNFIGNGKC
jgi:glutamine amidotransferase